jgi:hypothetical protein
MRILFYVLILVAPVVSFSQKTNQNHYPGQKVSDELWIAENENSQILGMLGNMIDSCISNGVMAVNYHLYSEPFKNKTDRGGKFQGEFWGKWFTSAVLAYGYQPTKEHKVILDSSIRELLESQDSDGRISSYPREETFVNWDIWGRKYALLGLLAYYEKTGDKQAMEAAVRATDELIEIAGPGKKKLTDTGLKVLGSMSSNSILEPVVLVYKYSGNKKYLDFARYIVKQWSEPSTYSAEGIRLIENALLRVYPVNISSPKAYEMMSCYEGLCELYRATGDSIYLKAVTNFANSLLEREIMITGSGSSTELWCDGAFRQTELLEQPMETCVTVTWMKLCYQLLRVTGNSVWADQMEISLYNSLKGAMNSEGNWWAYFSPLAGERMPSPMQVPSCESSCCVANGPRGLLTIPQWAVMVNENGPVINLYTQGSWKGTLAGGTDYELNQITDYPKGDKVEITIRQKKSVKYTISLRIPEWSKTTEIKINGEKIDCSAGEYARITREWKDGDKIELILDMRGRIIQAPGNINDMAVMRGPVVLAMDNRFIEPADYNLWLYPANTKWESENELGNLRYVLPRPVNQTPVVQYIELTPVQNKPDNVWMAFEVPFLYKYTHFFKHSVKKLVMCDYASAGNLYTTDNLFRVWISQPLFMNDIFPNNTWKILFREGEKRPVFPELKHPGDIGNTWERRD